jgi:hypothetical protein
MSMALCRGLDLSFAGQTITHKEQPVQSSAATWMVYFAPFHSLPRKSVDLKLPGAPASFAGA